LIAIYVCPKCKKEFEINSVGNTPHFKRRACECGNSLHFKEIEKNELTGDLNAGQ
jgi:DNA-directed RNA polymerase subunit RPC12/RpoP